MADRPELQQMPPMGVRGATAGLVEPSPWGHVVVREQVRGIPYRIYADRPRRLHEVLALAARWGERDYVVQGERTVTFDELLARVHRAAAGLAEAGVGEGDRVLMLGWNSPDWIVNFWACQQVGAVPALANGWWGEAELLDAVELLQPVLALADESGAAKLPTSLELGAWGTQNRGGGVAASTPPPVSEDENEAAVVIFTSGTSGRAKAVEISHRSVLANLQMLLQLTRRLPQQVDEHAGEVALHTGPLFHVGGPQMLARSIAVGNTIVMPEGRFDPADVLELVERRKVVRWSAVPTMVTRILDHPDLHVRDLSSLKSVTIGGAPVYAELLERIGRELPGVDAGVPTGYGLTENCGQATAASGRDTLRYPGSAGRPLPCVELSFLPLEGLPDTEILIRSPTQMTRYLGGEPSPIDDQGWLHTGDLGHLDDDGRLWITGRSKDLIIRGGENIAPAAVERALLKIDGVKETSVVGVPHPDLGEEVFAFVVTEAAHTGESLRERLRGQISSFAVPSRWHIQAEALPTNQTGKVDKPMLATMAREATAREDRD